MTSEEKRAWRTVTTAGEAQEMIDLFWARRDPTPGTFLNEFREEFRRRVEFADRRFQEGNRRGALTERGRVLIVLGFPREMGEEAEWRTGQVAGPAVSNDPTGGRAIAARDAWNYSYEESIRFGLPKIEVVFIRDGVGGRVRRDTHRNDFIAALPAAIHSYIRSPGLTAVPDWARGEVPRLESAEPQPDMEALLTSTPLPDAPEAGPQPPSPAGTSSGAVAGPPKGAGKLTLVHDAFAINPESGTDPFADLAETTEFRRDGDLGWVLQYCSGSEAAAGVEVGLRITGMVKGERINFTAPPEDLVPDSIRALPGCHLVRGTIPLMEIDPGNYTLFVTVATYNLARQFRIIE